MEFVCDGVATNRDKICYFGYFLDAIIFVSGARDDVKNGGSIVVVGGLVRVVLECFKPAGIAHLCSGDLGGIR